MRCKLLYRQGKAHHALCLEALGESGLMTQENAKKAEWNVNRAGECE